VGTALQRAITAGAILAAVATTAALWIRDHKLAVVAVVILSPVIGLPALGRALGDGVNRLK
jgi:hypothetical protein